jgi:hypothetical protein
MSDFGSFVRRKRTVRTTLIGILLAQLSRMERGKINDITKHNEHCKITPNNSPRNIQISGKALLPSFAYKSRPTIRRSAYDMTYRGSLLCELAAGNQRQGSPREDANLAK